MDEAIDGSLPPDGVAAAVPFQPPIVGRPVRRLVLMDDLENLGQPGITAHQGMTKQDFDLPVTALLGERDDPT